MPFLGFDHIDCRVRSLAAVESFYDEFMPRIGLPEKRYAFVDPHGEWHNDADTYNVIEYYETAREGHTAHFMGLIEDPMHRHNDTRLAFRVARSELDDLAAFLARIGAQQIEWSEDLDAYPALFFEDPSGTKLELLGR